jgi:hypothetical protein
VKGVEEAGRSSDKTKTIDYEEGGYLVAMAAKKYGG